MTTTSEPIRLALLVPTTPPARTLLAPVGPPQVFSQTTDQKTSYQVRDKNGKLQVSAPVGSTEAQLFVEVVRINAQPNPYVFNLG